MTEMIEAAKLTTNHTLVDSKGKVGFISSINRAAGRTLIRVNGQLVSLIDTKKVRVRAA